MSLARVLVIVGFVTLLDAPTFVPAQETKGPPGVKLDGAGEPLPAGAVARLGSTRFRHAGAVGFVGYSGDGKILITSSGESSLRFWDAKTGKEIRRIDMPMPPRRYVFRSGPPSVHLSGDGKTLVIGADEGECTVIDVAAGKTLKEFKTAAGPGDRFGEGGGARCQLSHDGRRLLVLEGGQNRGASKVAVWDTATGLVIRQLEPKGKGETFFTAATLSRDGKTLICVDGLDQDRKFDPKDKTDRKTQIRFLDVAGGQELRALPCPLVNTAELLMTADGKHLLVRDRDGQAASLIDATTGKEGHSFAGKQRQPYGMMLAPDDKSIFIADFNQVTQYDLKSGKPEREIPLRVNRFDDDEFGPYGRINRFSMAVSPDGKTLAVPHHATVAFWDLKTGKEIPIDDGHRNRIDSVAFGPTGKQVLTGAADGGLFLWNIADSKRVQAFSKKDTGPDDVRDRRGGGGERVDWFHVRGNFSPDGKTITGLWWGDKLHIWDAATGKLLHHLGGARGATSFSHAPDGKTIALADGDGRIVLYNAEAGREIKAFGPPALAEPMNPEERDFDRFEQGAYTSAFSPDGRMIISGGMHIEPNGLRVQIKYWEIATGQARVQAQTRMNFDGRPQWEMITAALDSFVVGFAFTPDSKAILEAGFSNVKLRDLRTGAEIRAFGGKQIAAHTSVLSPDGKMLVAGKFDGALRVWDVATGTVLTDFPAHQSRVVALAFSADGKRLASGAVDASVLIWDWDHIRQKALDRTTTVAAARLEPLWDDLASKDATTAYTAIKGFAVTPVESVAFLKTHVRPAPPVDPNHLKKLLDDLDHASYSTRQKAEEALFQLGDLAGPALRTRRAGKPSVESARRLDGLLKKLEARVLTVEVLQALRAIEALELIASPDARALIDAVAKGAPGHRVTEDAKASLGRLKK
ncbi:MAG: PQQ-binding-like beta-propeller repeat protein [Planctomycetes bacterium]|nr:PQQ-binding-like beta-propeller repeat protein [Planctomycetota bacterium]